MSLKLVILNLSILITISSCSVKKNISILSEENSLHKKGHSGRYLSCSLCNPKVHDENVENMFSENDFFIADLEYQKPNLEMAYTSDKFQTNGNSVINSFNEFTTIKSSKPTRKVLKRKLLKKINHKEESKSNDDNRGFSHFGVFGFILTIIANILFFMAFESPTFGLVPGLFFTFLALPFIAIGLYEGSRMDKKGQPLYVIGLFLIIISMFILLLPIILI